MRNNKGQLSIFMGITMILVMGMLAFVINVGLFVKAKINLQNSVDAAAFAGASVQARQLTNIAYANWEMRNTYKEWMFKYYVLGQLGLLSNPYSLGSNSLVGTDTKFYLYNPGADVLGASQAAGFDMYNVPSICIHNNNQKNICPLYTLPGIPRFQAIGVAGISEIHEAFVNKIVEEKGANCIARTQLNFLTALAWAYSSGIREIPGTPLVATNRVGAWPQALELAMRIRNLEMIVNRPAITDPIDYTMVQTLANEGTQFGLNERPIKAFLSAFRNMSGGKYKNNVSGTAHDEFATSFRLYEIAPQPYEAQPSTVSSFLIPTQGEFSYSNGMGATQKQYLDLQVMPLNYATMFSTFAGQTGSFEDVTTEQGCVISKTAMPVPGYLLGFVKNPAVMTYYAVKGEANFTGLFFPKIRESDTGSIKLTAYAAAKPFGGRIGPRLFTFADNNGTVEARDDGQKRSTAYISGLKAPAVPGFVAGAPLPTTQNFWDTNTSKLGGVPEKAGTQYGVPNILYDFESQNDLSAQSGTAGKIQELGPRASSALQSSLTPEKAGLYNVAQFKMLKSNLGSAGAGTSMSGEDVMKSIVKARGVTRYDAVNYLIPDYRESSDGNNSIPLIKPLADAVQGGEGINYALFAPLVGPGLLYTNTASVVKVVNGYLRANESAINTYLGALLEVANKIASSQSKGGSGVNLTAARSLHVNAPGSDFKPPPMSSGDPMDTTGCAQDLASKFNQLFTGTKTQCGIVPLEVLMDEYINKQLQGGGNLYYKTTYYNKHDPAKVMTAFYPSQRQNVSQEGRAIVTHPVLGNVEYSARRNYYSTKFFNMALIMEPVVEGRGKIDYEQNPLLREETTRYPPDLLGTVILNPIKGDASTGLNKKFFLDF
jgi:hypothetical protein